MFSKYILLVLLLSSVVLFTSLNKTDEKEIINHVYSVAGTQYKELLNKAKDLSKFPRSTAENGEVLYVDSDDWTGGFWPGSLWYVYEYTQDKSWKDAALKWTQSLESNQYNTKHHDIGFVMYCSYGNAYRLTKDTSLLPVLIQSAKSLISRYSPKVASIKSWNSRKIGDTLYNYPVIIDNMMNLELLFFASEKTKDPVYKNIAIKHAETTMKNHIRPDYSSYHMVNYDAETGDVTAKKTVQGFADNSLWARGQAWGVYGFTVVFRETKDQKFLKTAQKMADYYLNHKNLPADYIPQWDFNVGQPGYHPNFNFDPQKYNPVPRDASAAAVMASALLELSKYSNPSLKARYYQAAVKMLSSLAGKNYLAKPGTNNNFLLKNSVGNMAKYSEVNTPIIYADYYFLEALLRLKNYEVTS